MTILGTAVPKRRRFKEAEGVGFGARKGERIRGRLFRGGSGKFASGPTDDQLGELGVSRELSDALLSALKREEMTPEALGLLRDSGMLGEGGALSRDARALALAFRARNIKQANAILKRIEKGKKGKGGGGGSKAKTAEQKREENRKKIRDELGGTIKLENFDALLRFFDGEELSGATANALLALGLVTKRGGEFVLSVNGRRVARAANRGDVRSVLDAIAKAREDAKKETETSESEVSSMLINEKAIRAHETGTDKSASWDGPAAMADAPNDSAVLRYMSAWVNESGDPNAKSSYKFPHHLPRTGSAAIISGVNNGLARLSQAKIPAADRAGVEAHLRAHRKDAGLSESMSEAEIFDAVAAIMEEDEVDEEQAYGMIEALLETEGETAVEGTVEEYYPEPYAISRATSFADLEMARKARETSRKISRWASEFPMLVFNIMSSEEGDKAAAVKALATEFAEMVATELTAEAMGEFGTEPAIGDDLGTQIGGFLEDETEAEDLTESALGQAIGLVESSGSGPLLVDVQIIRPGWGNKRHNHYYPKKMLRRDAGVFSRAKMFETDHKPEETNNRTWVSTIIEAGERFTEDGAPIGRVGIHDPAFAQKVRNLAELDVLDSLQCSIRADGRVRKEPFTENGRTGKLVESITKARSIDWVVNAGAGGHALALVENDEEVNMSLTDEQVDTVEETEVEEVELVEEDAQETEQEDPTPTPLTETAVADVIDGLKSVPDAVKSRVLRGEYITEDEVREAVETEIAYVKELTGSGSPLQLGEVEQPETGVQPLTEDESRERFNDIFAEFGLPT